MKTPTFTTKTPLFCKLLLLLLAALLLVSCNQTDKSPEDTTEQTEETSGQNEETKPPHKHTVEPIDEDELVRLMKAKRNEKDPATICYYGMFNGCVVARYEHHFYPIFRNVWVEGIVFHFSGYSEMKVYQDGKSFYLQEAYDKGLLTKEQLQILFEIDEEESFIEYLI